MSPVSKKNLISTLLILAGFLVISFVFNYPALQGKVLAAHDNFAWRGVSEEMRAWNEKHGGEALWTNSVFGGMPGYTINGVRAGNYTFLLLDNLRTVLPKPVNFFFLAMVSFFILTSVMKMKRWLGAIGAVAFAFTTYYSQIVAAGHDTKVMDIICMPAVLAGFLLLARGKYLGGAALMGLSFSLMMGNGHFQIMWYMFIILLFVGIGLLIQAYKDGTVKQTLIGGIIAIAIVGVASATNISSLILTSDYTKDTQRGGASELQKETDSKNSGGLDRDYAFRWSNGVGETFVLMVPYLYGGGSMENASRLPRTSEALGEQQEKLPSYWGPQADAGLAGPVYLGAVVCFLFVLGLMLIRNKVKWAILAVCILAVLMSTGKHLPGLNNFLFEYLPGYNKFRVPNMILVILQFLFPLVGVWGLHEVVSGNVDKQELWKKARVALIATAGLSLVIGLLSGMFLDFTNKATDAQFPAQLLETLKEDRAAMARNSGIISAVFILAAGALIWLYQKGNLKLEYMVGGIGLLIAIDLIPTGHNYLNEEKYMDKETYDAQFVPRAVDAQILTDKDPYYRVLDVSRDVFGDGMQCFHHKSVGGYSAAKLLSYQDLINIQMSKGFNSEVMNMLNVKYFIVPGGNQGGQEQMVRNDKAAGNAWFVSNIRWAKTATEEMMALNAPALGQEQDTTQPAGNFKPKETAIVREKFNKQLAGLTPVADPAATIQLDRYGLNEISYKSANSREGLGVFSDIYYEKGWKAYIDGKETDIIRADYVLRALRIPAGNHKIEFRFMPAGYNTGKLIGTICSLIIFALAAAWAFTAYKNQKSDIVAKEANV